ncbi:hypothetical protein DAI22_02g024401 [Oryza sativa Japonica Group]|nr:hypothetical protein DAI22_02g024401 [Oryza sativa Japonica Group]
MKDGGDDQRASVAKTDSISATERLQRASSTRPNNAQGQSNTNTSTSNTPLTIPRIPPYPSRINTMEIKQLIQTRLGHERSERYFRYLKMFLGRTTI